ncbi:MAG: hypothetical protein R3A13_07760, partial [Bdellovibrionota bacterium]
MSERDTSTEIQALMDQKYRAMTAEQRLIKLSALCATGRKLMIAGIKQRVPNADPDFIRSELNRI